MLSDNLKELRLAAGLKQDDLLKKFNLSSARYSQYEGGKRTPDYELLIKFADFYNVSTDYLLGREKTNKAISSQNAGISTEDEEFIREMKKLPEGQQIALKTLVYKGDYMIILKLLREKKALSQKEIATYINKTPQAYSLYEKGKRDPDTATLKKLADFFGVTTDYLLGYDTIESETKTSLSPEAERLMKKLGNTDATTIAELEQYLNYLESKKNLKKTSSNK